MKAGNNYIYQGAIIAGDLAELTHTFSPLFGAGGDIIVSHRFASPSTSLPGLTADLAIALNMPLPRLQNWSRGGSL